MFGGRKLLLGFFYLLGCFVITGMAIAKGMQGWDAAGIASICVSISTGLGVVVYGNVQEHRAKNAGGGNGSAGGQ